MQKFNSQAEAHSNRRGPPLASDSGTYFFLFLYRLQAQAQAHATAAADLVGHALFY
tara:strand:+ start:82 stop:249 length:168 start_codon:yes stop_codon:yes gene_type:complete